MKTLSRRFLFLTVVVLFMLGGYSAQAEESIKIGMTYPPTILPNLASEVDWAVDIALEEINSSGGILGRRLEVILEMDECTPKPGVVGLRKLLHQDNVDMLMGAICSTVSLAQMPIIQEEKIPYLMAICTNPTITDQMGIGGNNWAFRLNANDRMQVKPFARWIMSQDKYKTFSIITKSDAFGKAVGKLWQKHLPSFGGKILSLQYNDKDQEDFTSFITRIKAENPDAILASTDGVSLMARFVNQAASLGLVKPTFNVGGAVSTQFIKLVGADVAKNVYSVTGYTPISSSPENLAWVDKFMNYPKNKDHDKPTKISTQTRIALHLIKDVYERAGTTEKNAVREALAATSIKSLIGHIKFDEYHQAHPSVFIIGVENGVVVTKAEAEEEN